MNVFMQTAQKWLGNGSGQGAAMAAPILVMLVLAMLVLPLPPWLLDTLFTLNIALALTVMMVAAYMKRALDFAAFPTVLLLTTLMRLSLNVASTRVVLMEGHAGPGAAGSVIEAFGTLLVGGNFAVGVIVFLILVVINFIVITKGAERIAEVGAGRREEFRARLELAVNLQPDHHFEAIRHAAHRCASSPSACSRA